MTRPGSAVPLTCGCGGGRHPMKRGPRMGDAIRSPQPTTTPRRVTARREGVVLPLRQGAHARPRVRRDGSPHARAAAVRQEVLVRRVRRRVAWLVYAGGLVGVPVLWLLARWHLVASRPLWLLFVVVLAAAVVGRLADRSFASRPTALTIHLRVAMQSAAVAAMLYLTGWGPALAIGFGYPILDNAYYVGARARWAIVGWPVVGQVLVSSGAVALLVGAGTANALAAVDSLAIAFVGLLVVQLAAGREDVEHELAFAASHDGLTGLMNRATFLSRLQRVVVANRRSDRPVAVLFCDLLGFKTVNDSLGHRAGDQALVEVATRFARAIRGDDLVARFAGDEFVVALCAPASPTDAVRAAERLIGALEQPVVAGANRVRLGLSIGIAYSRSSWLTPARLVARADQAMYEAKATRRSAWSLRELR